MARLSCSPSGCMSMSTLLEQCERELYTEWNKERVPMPLPRVLSLALIARVKELEKALAIEKAWAKGTLHLTSDKIVHPDTEGS